MHTQMPAADSTTAATNREVFAQTYRRELARAVAEHPELFTFPTSEVPRVAERMLAAIDRRGYNKDGIAFRATCKALGIKYTYKAIDAFLSQDSTSASPSQ